jgi:E3 ubiquitin-protein ligase UBR2
MLYNDEVHSYEQVVNTLRKVLNIDDKKAFEYAAIVDKEGNNNNNNNNINYYRYYS